jgi:DNA-binding transcriptional LysR family regulator
MSRSRMTFDMNLLKIFDALFQHGSVNAAASEMGVSPSAISHALGRLRDIFEDELFVKAGGSMTPTARAAEIADRVSAIVLQVHSVLGRAKFDPETAERHFKLRCTGYMGSLILPKMVNYLAEKAPNVTLHLDFDYSKGIVDDLDSGAADLAIAVFGQTPDRFDSEFLISDRWVWVLRADHPALSPDLTTEKLLELPQFVIALSEVRRSIDGVITDAGLERFAVSDKMFLPDAMTKARYGSQVKGKIVANSSQVAPSILEQSDLVALLPERQANEASKRYNLKTIRFEKEVNVIEHRMIWHRNHGADPAIAWLRLVLRSLAADLQ